MSKRKHLVCAYDPRERTRACYTPTNFRWWVHDVFMEGYKRKPEGPPPSLREAIEIAESFGIEISRKK